MKFISIAGAAALALFLGACDATDGPIERAAEDVEEAVDGNDTVAEDVEEAAEEAGENIEEAAEDLDDAVDGNPERQ